MCVELHLSVFKKHTSEEGESKTLDRMHTGKKIGPTLIFAYPDGCMYHAKKSGGPLSQRPHTDHHVLPLRTVAWP